MGPRRKYSLIPIKSTSLRNDEVMRPRTWGAIPELGIPPFQLFFKIGNSTDYVLNGYSFKTIERRSEKGELHNRETLCAFKPNPIETCVSTGKHDTQFPVRISAYSERSDFRERLAWIYFCYVDIDLKQFQTDIERIEAVDRALIEWPIKPSVIVGSGNGLHLYFSVEPIDLISLGQENEVERDHVESRFRKVQEGLCKLFSGDPNPASNITGNMRIPDTFNVKSMNGKAVKTRCHYFWGDLTLARRHPDYTLEELEDLLGIQPIAEAKTTEVVARNKEKSKTPRPKYSGFTTFIKNLELNLNTKFRRFERSYIKFLYGYRDLSWIIEATFKGQMKERGRKYSGSAIKKVREKLIRLGLMKNLQKFPLVERMGWVYELADGFFAWGGITKQTASTDRRANALETVLSYSYAKGKRLRDLDVQGKTIAGIDYDYPLLRSAGFGHQEVREILREKIRNRPPGLPRGEQEMQYIDQWENFYCPISKLKVLTNCP